MIAIARMAVVDIQWDKSGVAPLEPGPFKRAVVRALRKAGSTALRDTRSEATKRIRQRKRIKASYISRAITLRRATGSDITTMQRGVEISGEPVPLVAYPHPQSVKGVSVEVNQGNRTLVKGLSVATVMSGHTGVLRR